MAKKQSKISTRPKTAVVKKKRTPKKKAQQKRRNSDSHYSFHCIQVQQGRYVFYIFACNAKDLWDIVKVNRREEDKDEGYQRAFSNSRVSKLAKFIDTGNCLPGAVLVSFDKAEFLKKDSTLKIENTPDSGWVIDGQHRLIGAHKAETEITIPVIGFIELSEIDQVQLFVTINKEQKGVPSSLYYDLLSKLPRELSESELLQERANDIATSLKRNPDSPFYNRIRATTAPKPGQLSVTNVVRKLIPHIRPDGHLSSFNDEERCAVLNNLYKALHTVYPKEYGNQRSIFFQTVGFGGLMESLPSIIEATIRLSGKNLRVISFANVFRSIGDFDFGSWKQLGSGSKAEKRAGEDLRTRLVEEMQSAPGMRIEF